MLADEPHQREALADEVGIALVEVGARDASLGLVRDAAQTRARPRSGLPAPRRRLSGACRRPAPAISAVQMLRGHRPEWMLRIPGVADIGDELASARWKGRYHG